MHQPNVDDVGAVPGAVRRRWAWANSAFVALAATAAMTLVSLPTAQPARADAPIGPILGAAGKVLPYVSAVETAYGLFNTYLATNRPPSELQQIAALIQQSTTDIKAQVDADSVADVTGDADTVLEQFENFSTMTGDPLKAFVNQAVGVVNQAKSHLNSVVTGKDLDELGFDLNVIGPIALVASAKDNQATDQLLTSIRVGNELAVQKLAPKCGVFAVDLNNTGPRAAQGHCWSYQATFPTNPQTQVPENVNNGSIGSNDSTVVGNYDGFDFTAPPVTDFSQAADQVMAATSYPIAQAALLELEPAVPQVSPSVSLVAETASNQASAPLDVFGAGPTGDPFRGNIAPGAVTPASFSGWSAFPGVSQLRSVTSAADSDGRVEMFGLDRIGQVWHRWQRLPGDDTSWLPWDRMDGILNSITVAHDADGGLQLFGTGPTGASFSRWQRVASDETPPNIPVPAKPDVNTWSGWKQMDGTMVQDVAVTNSANRIEVFGIDAAGVLWHREQLVGNVEGFTDPTEWTGWTRVSGAPANLRQITATTNNAGQIFLAGVDAARTTSDVVKVGDQGGNGDYSAWGQIPGSVSQITAAREGGASGSIQLVGLDAAGNVFRNRLSGAVSGSPAPAVGWSAVRGGSSPSIAAGPAGSWTVAFQADDSALWTKSSTGAVGRVGGGSGHPMAAGTGPSIAAVPSGGFEIAYQTSDGLLGTVSPAGTVAGLGLGMAPGTSPSIAVAADGSWEVAFQANDGTLWTRSSTGAGGRVGGGAGHAMMPGTSPAVAALSTGGFEIAYQTSDGLLGTVSPAGSVAGLGLAMATGTGPSITAGPNGTWEIAFQANDGTLWTRTSTGAGGRVGGGAGHPVMPGTSPSVTTLSSGGFQVAYQTSDGLVSAVSPAGALTSLGLGMWAAGSPAIAPSGAGFQTAAQANTGTLWTRSPSGSATDSLLGMPRIVSTIAGN